MVLPSLSTPPVLEADISKDPSAEQIAAQQFFVSITEEWKKNSPEGPFEDIFENEDEPGLAKDNFDNAGLPEMIEASDSDDDDHRSESDHTDGSGLNQDDDKSDLADAEPARLAAASSRRHTDQNTKPFLKAPSIEAARLALTDITRLLAPPQISGIGHVDLKLNCSTPD